MMGGVPELSERSPVWKHRVIGMLIGAQRMQDEEKRVVSFK